MSTLLIVEDDPYVRDVLEELLRLRGYDVRTASDGEAALAAMEKLHPDAVIADVKMQHMGGAELLASMKLRRDLAAIPVIITSGWRHFEAAPEGAAAFLPKPFHVDDVLTALQQVLPPRPVDGAQHPSR